VHAAADALFAAFLPRLDSGQLRQLGAHLREAAGNQDRAADEHDDYARRSLRISRSLHGAGEITGRLHAEAAEQVIAAFEQLGGRTGPDDKRTKTQRWADVLTRLAGLSSELRPHSSSSAPADNAGPAWMHARGQEDDDQPGPADASTGHDHASRDYNSPTRHDRVHQADDFCPGCDHADPARDFRAGQAHADPARDFGADPARDFRTGHDRIGQARGRDDAHRAPGHHGHADTGPEHDADQERGVNGFRPDGPGGQPSAGYQRPRIIVTVPLSTLLGQPLAPGATLGAGTPLTPEAARRLACDAEIIRLITAPDHPPDGSRHDNGGTGIGTAATGDATARLTELMAAAIAGLPPPLATPSAVLDIGRKSPGWTPRQRDALHAQYGGHCAFGRCDGPIEVIHHIIHWLYGGKTRIINGFPCCLYHHWLIHEGGWRIVKHPDGTITTCPPPPGWRPGTVYRHGQPVTEHAGPADTP
jgi:hypothetical protein